MRTHSNSEQTDWSTGNGIDQVAVGFSFEADWLRGWYMFSKTIKCGGVLWSFTKTGNERKELLESSKRRFLLRDVRKFSNDQLAEVLLSFTQKGIVPCDKLFSITEKEILQRPVTDLIAHCIKMLWSLAKLMQSYNTQLKTSLQGIVSRFFFVSCSWQDEKHLYFFTKLTIYQLSISIYSHRRKTPVFPHQAQNWSAFYYSLEMLSFFSET